VIDTPSAAGRMAMEGQGAYNRNSGLQGRAADRAVPLLEQAARAVDPGPDDRPIQIADYGSSQGQNSLHPIRSAIAVLRNRFGAERPIRVTHTDLPANDFSTLFNTVFDAPESYLRDHSNVFADAVGRSFYGPLLPPAQVSLGWSSYAVNWLSRVPALIPGHFHSLRATGAAREAFDSQAATDWLTFLSLRARELRPTGRLVIVTPSVNETGLNGAELLYDAANDSIAELVTRGTISETERARMVSPGRQRGRDQLLAPFAATGSFAGLTVEHCELYRNPEMAWQAYLGHGDAAVLATARARTVRSIFMPTLIAALDAARTQADRLKFADALEAAMVRRFTPELHEIMGWFAIMVVARQPAERAS
jgi:SAM dependent carboxyl methyltransferase